MSRLSTGSSAMRTSSLPGLAPWPVRGLALLNIVAIPLGDFNDIGSGFFDDGLAAKARVQFDSGGGFEAVEFEVFGLAEAAGSLLYVQVAGGAGADSAARVVEKDVVVFGDVEEGHGLAVAFIGERVEGELDGAAFGLEGDAHHVLGRRGGKIDFGCNDSVLGHRFHSKLYGKYNHGLRG
jgi:hypothetical protein